MSLNSEDRIVRELECKKLTGLSRSTRWRLEQAHKFPKRRKISDNAIGWLKSELDKWLNEKVTP